MDTYLMKGTDDVDSMSFEVLRARARELPLKQNRIDYCQFLERICKKLFRLNRQTLRRKYFCNFPASKDDEKRFGGDLAFTVLPYLVTREQTRIADYCDLLESTISYRLWNDLKNHNGIEIFCYMKRLILFVSIDEENESV